MADEYPPTLFYKGNKTLTAYTWAEHYQLLWEGWSQGGPAPDPGLNDYLTVADLADYAPLESPGFTGSPTLNGQPLGGTDGADGDSAYQVAVANGFVGTQAAWLASLKGAKGDPGSTAYQVAVANGFVGTQAAWLASLVGPAGPDGPSAYQVAVTNGFVGDQTAWLATLIGPEGPPADTTALDAAVQSAQDAAASVVRGQAGGVAGLDADGDVIDGTGTKVLAGGNTGGVTSTQLAEAEARASDRANHTGTQEIATVDGLQDALDAAASTGSGTGAVVRDLKLTSAVVCSDDTTWQTASSVSVPDAETGQVWHVSPMLKYTGPGGLEFRLAEGGGASNLLPDPSFESGTSSFPLLQPASGGLTTTTVGVAADGSAYAVITANVAGNHLLYSRTVDAVEGDQFMGDIAIRTGAGPARTCRLDVNFRSFGASATAEQTTTSGSLGFDLGTSAERLSGTDWGVRLTTDTPDTAPVGTLGARLRLAWLNAAIGDQLHIDLGRMVRGATLPDINAAGGINQADFEVSGLLEAKDVASNSTFPRDVDYAADATTVKAFPTTGKSRLTGDLRIEVNGTGLIGQELLLQFRQDSANATATQVEAGSSYVVWSRSA